MRKKNAIAEFSSQRSEALIKSYRESLARQSVISTQKAFQEAVDAPAPRFWVSEARAMRVITMMKKSFDILEGMHPEKQLMYMEIYERVMQKQKENPLIPLGDIVFEVVNSPAPRSYLTWRWCRKIVRTSNSQPPCL